jgi:superoxide dismutase, Fe-Mn family
MTEPETDIDRASEPHGISPDAAGLATLTADTRWIDVRRRPVFEQARTLLPGARWHDPLDTAGWLPTLPQDRPVVVYCVHGHAVSRGVLLQLRAAGIDARFLRGGIEGWQAAGRPVVDKATAS